MQMLHLVVVGISQGALMEEPVYTITTWGEETLAKYIHVFFLLKILIQ